jgi:hypothetical protein
MPKNVSSAVLTNQRKTVATQATLLKITRVDGVVFLLTNHDTDIVFNGETYTHSIPFVLSAISSGSQLAVDNIDLTLSLDETVFKLADFKRLAYQHAAVEITEVDFTAPEDGGMSLRKGWFGPIQLGQYGVARITVVGLLKVLDLEVGRVYQPSCDADLGDARCKVAINLNQQRDWRETMHTGDWRYVFNTAAANQITLVNPSFEDDGVITDKTQPITGWVKVPFDVAIMPGTLGTYPDPTDGLYGLNGEDDATNSERQEAFVYQDVDLVAAGIDPADIDDGRISFAYFCDLMQTAYLLDPVRIATTLYGENGETIYQHDTGFIKPAPTFEEWRTKQLVFPIFSGTRHVRLIIGFRKTDGIVYNAAADNVRAYWWDHVDGSPWDDVIHKVVRIADLSNQLYAKYPTNGSFELSAAPMGTTQNINGWTKAAGSPWGTAGNVYGFGSPSQGSRIIVAGNNGTGVQSTYEISQTINLIDTWKLTASRIAAGAIVGTLFYGVIWGDTESAAQVALEFRNASNVVISTQVLTDFEPKLVPTVENIAMSFVIPAAARSMRIILRARSPLASSLASIGFDNIYAGVVDAVTINKQDPVAGSGLPGTVFSTTAGSYTFDGSLIWRAFSHHVQYDVVSSVTSRKQFIGSDISGIAGSYETGVILWISGENRGQRNLIRVWDPDTRGIKLYFESVYPIQPGDRFQYIRSCQKRFVEDCQLRYDNVINFRGFPHLPGKLRE